LHDFVSSGIAYLNVRVWVVCGLAAFGNEVSIAASFDQLPVATQASPCRTVTYRPHSGVVDTRAGGSQHQSMRILTHALAVFLCCIVLPGAAWAAGSRAACNRDRAKATTIEVVRAEYSAWSGRCVSLRGIAVGARLFADRMATLEPKSAFGEEVRRSIVLYKSGRHLQDRKVRMVEVTGTIGSCADQNAAVGVMQAENPNDIIMVSGYCHTSLETYIQPVSIRILSRAPMQRCPRKAGSWSRPPWVLPAWLASSPPAAQ